MLSSGRRTQDWTLGHNEGEERVQVCPLVPGGRPPPRLLPRKNNLASVSRSRAPGAASLRLAPSPRVRPGLPCPAPCQPTLRAARQGDPQHGAPPRPRPCPDSPWPARRRSPPAQPLRVRPSHPPPAPPTTPCSREGAQCRQSLLAARKLCTQRPSAPGSGLWARPACAPSSSSQAVPGVGRAEQVLGPPRGRPARELPDPVLRGDRRAAEFSGLHVVCHTWPSESDNSQRC